MAFTWLGGCCLLLILAQPATASREEMEAFSDLEKDGDAASTKMNAIFKEQTNLVCGGSSIREALSRSSGRTVNWAEIIAVAEAFDKKNQVVIDNLQRELDRLKEEIPKAEAKEAPEDMKAQQITDLITQSLTPHFGSIENAKAAMCGGADGRTKSKLQPRVQPGAYRKSQAQFEELAKPILENTENKVRVSGEQVVQECTKIIPEPQGQEAKSWCGELCQAFADFAGSTSNRVAGGINAGARSDELRRQQQEKTDELKYAIGEQSECRAMRATLEGYQAELGTLNQDIKDQHDKHMLAQEALEEAEEKMYDLEMALEEQQKTTEEAIKALQGAGDSVAAAKKAFNEVQDAEQNLKKEIQETKDKIEDLKNTMENCQQSVDAVTELKEKVAIVGMKMNAMYEAAIKSPLNDLGIYSYTDTDEYFNEPTEKMESRQELEKTLKNINTLCVERALPVFQQLSNGQELGQLCEFGGVQPALEGIDQAVEKRREGLKKAFRGLRALLNPYSFLKGLTEEMVAEKFVKEGGEPNGLRILIPRFGKTAFFNKYLKKWFFRAKGGYLELMKKLGVAIEAMEKDQTAAMDKMKELAELAKKNNDKKAEAQKALDAAVKTNQLAGEAKKQAEEALAKTQEQMTQAESNLEALQKAEQEAYARFKAAQEKLKTTHSTALGLSFLQERFGLNATGQSLRTKHLSSGQLQLSQDLS